MVGYKELQRDMTVILIMDFIQRNVTLFSHFKYYLVNRSVRMRMLDPLTCKSYLGKMLLHLAQIVSVMLLIDNECNR